MYKDVTTYINAILYIKLLKYNCKGSILSLKCTMILDFFFYLHTYIKKDRKIEKKKKTESNFMQNCTKVK